MQCEKPQSFLWPLPSSAWVTSRSAAVFCLDVRGHRRRFLQPTLLLTQYSFSICPDTHAAWPLRAGPLLPGPSSLLPWRPVPTVQSRECRHPGLETVISTDLFSCPARALPSCLFVQLIFRDPLFRGCSCQYPKLPFFFFSKCLPLNEPTVSS